MRRFSMLLAFALLPPPPAARAADEGWVSLFDGKTLAGWKASESPGSFRVVDGAIACDGPRSHLFYVGADGKAAFESFEADGRGQGPRRRQLRLLLPHRLPGEGLAGPGLRGAGQQLAEAARRLPRAQDDRQPLRHPERLQGAGEGRRVVHPARDRPEAARRDPRERHAGRGLDRARRARFPRERRSSTASAAARSPCSATTRRARSSSGTCACSPLPDPCPRSPPDAPRRRALRCRCSTLGRANFPLVDLHAHLKGGLTLEQALALSREHRHVPRPRRELRQGLPRRDRRGRPRVPEDDGGPARLRRHAGRGPRVGHDVLEGDPREVRLRLHRRHDLDEPRRASACACGCPTRSRSAPTSRPSWTSSSRRSSGSSRRSRSTSTSTPTFLPAAIAPRYDALWTEARMNRVIDAAVKNGVAIEIGARYKIPSEALPPPRQGPRREVHLRDEQRRGERPRRLVLPAGDAEEARPEVAGHVRPRPPAEPRAAGVAGARAALLTRAAAARARDGAAADGQPARSPAAERGGPDPLRRARRHLPRQPARRLHGEELRRRLRRSTSRRA